MVSSPQQAQGYSSPSPYINATGQFSPGATPQQRFQAMPQFIDQRHQTVADYKAQQMATNGRINPFALMRVAAQGLPQQNVAQALRAGVR